MEVKDKMREKLINQATILLKSCKAKMPDFSKMDNGQLISFIKSLKYYKNVQNIMILLLF